MRKSLAPLLCLAAFSLDSLAAADPPRAEITNGSVRAQLYLPDAENGFYRGTRFDWSGVISSLEYQGHTYFGQWFARYDPSISDTEYDPSAKGYAAGRHSASMGPVEEFTGEDRNPLGYAEAPVGGTFIKIGVGALRKPAEDRYIQYNDYEMVDPGEWTTHPSENQIEFIQELSNGEYGYIYRKTVTLTPGKPELVLDHELRNTGKRRIETSVYNHNFFVIDKQPSGPDFTITFPFDARARRPMEGLVAVEGRQLRYLKAFENDDVASSPIEGFGESASDYDFRVENRKTGAGVRVRGDRPLSRILFWTIGSVCSPEAFNKMSIEPGGQATWKVSYEFYTLPASAGN